MKRLLVYSAQLLLILGISLGLLLIQSTIWRDWFGTMPAPILWIPVVVYLALFRPLFDALAGLYMVAFAVESVSAIPLGILLTLLLIQLATLTFLKQRIYWTGITYFVLATSISVAVFHLSHLILSWTFEINPITHPDLLSWLAHLLYAPLFSPLIYRVIRLVDWQERDANENRIPGVTLP